MAVKKAREFNVDAVFIVSYNKKAIEETLCVLYGLIIITNFEYFLK